MVTYTKTPGHSPCTGAVRPSITRSVTRLLAFLFSLLLLTTTAFSQVDDFNQAQNDKNGAGAPYNIDWVNGILNATHTAYFEGVGIPQRLIFTNIPATSGNVHVVKFEHLAVAGGKHAYDFLMSWQQAQATAGDHGNGTVNELQRLFLDQCNGAASADGLATCSALVPFVSSDDPNAVSSRYRRLSLPDNMADPSIGGNVAGKIACFEGIYGNRYIELIGNANITNASITFDGYKPGTDLAEYTITWTSTSDDVMIRFAGRAAKGPGACGYGSGLGAGSISGGNYHFKLASLDGAPTGSQDNQLMSNAIPEPPDCGIEPGKLACPNTPSLTFSYTGVTTGVSLVWSFLSNTANAVIQNTTANPTVTIVPGAGGFTPGGSFQLHLAVTKDGVTTECDQATASTIQNVVAQATADPTTIILTAANHSSQLNARVSLDGGTTYLTDAQADAQFTFSWVKDPPTPTGGTLSATNIRNPVFTAASPAQSHTFTVTATQKAAPFCSAQAPVTVEVSSGIPNCPEISGPDPVCEGTTGLTYSAAGSIPANTTYTWSIFSGNAQITSSTVNVTSITVNAGNTDYVVRLTMTFANANIPAVHCDYAVDVDLEPDANAGPDQRLCDATSITLAGNNPSVGTGTWTKQSGPSATITSPNAFNSTVTGLTPGTYVFRWTIVNGTCDDFDEVQVIIDAPVDANAGPDRALCAATSITLAGNNPSVGTGTWTKQSGPAATITSPNAFNSTVTGLTPGTYVFRWTIVNGTCDDFDEVTIRIDGDVIALAGDDQSLCAATLATLAGTNPSVGTGTWTKLSGPDVTITTPTAFNTSVTGLVTGTYVFRWTVANGECSAFDDVQVTIIPNPTCSIGGESSICSGSSNVYQGPAGMDAYAWSFVGAANGATFLNGVTNTQSVTIVAGTGNYTLQLIVTDNGCSSTCTQPVTVASCAVLCTYTQGAYGNAGGMHCNGQPAVPGPNQFTTAQYITNSINTYTLNSYTPALPNAAPFTNQMLVIGKPGRSVYMTSSVGDVGLIIEYLPGGGGSKVLGSGNISISNAAGMAQYLKNGRINNTLLAQTMTLGINLGGSGELGDFALEANKYLVTADVVSCGSTEIKECEFHWDGTQWVLDYTPYKVFGKIPQALYNAISPKTVRGLFTYANNVLGGDALASGVSLTMVADAVDLINNAFDECRDFVTWHSGVESYGVWVAPSAGSFCTPPAVTTARAIGANSEVVQTVDQLNVRAYPNPYNSTVSFNFTSPVKGNASLEVFDVVGRRLAIVFQGQVDAGIQKSVLYRVPTSSRVPMIYKLTIGDKTSYGKLLPGSTD